MATTRVIQYTTKPECAEENARLIAEVFADLAVRQPDGVRYASLRLDDGVSFLHLVTVEGEENPLLASPAFQAFQAKIGDRVAEGPTQSEVTVVGSYRVFDGTGA